MSHYAEQRENDLHSQQILQRIYLWRADCGFTPTVSQVHSNNSIQSDIRHALNALSYLYSIPKVHLRGTNVVPYLLGRNLSIYSPAEISLQWSSNPNYGKLSTIHQQLSSLKTLYRQLESEKLQTQSHYLAQKLLQHRLSVCLSMIELLRGSTVTKLVSEEARLLDNLAVFLQTLITSSQNTTLNSTPNNR